MVTKCPHCGAETRPVYHLQWTYWEEYRIFIDKNNKLEHIQVPTKESEENYQHAFSEDGCYACPECGDELDDDEVMAMLKEQPNV